MRWTSFGILLICASGLALIALGLFSLIRSGFAGVPALVFAGGAIITVFGMVRLIDEAAR